MRAWARTFDGARAHGRRRRGEPSCAGVRRFWREIRDQFETHEFVEQYDDVDGSFSGIGVFVVPR